MINEVNEEWLETLLTKPSRHLLDDLRKIKGDYIIIGAGGKMGPSLTSLLKNGLNEVSSQKKIYAVSRFSNPDNRKYLEDQGILTIAGDLLDPGFISTLPPCKNVIYMAGQKFGTHSNESLTWAINTLVPGWIAEKYKHSNIVAFSTGNVYPLMPVETKGATEHTTPDPIGEYAQSCLGRERIFEYYAKSHGTPVLIYRLNYALDLRYGVLNDIGQKIWNEQPIDLSMGYVNIIWQGDANEYAIRSLLHCTSPANHLNVTGPELHAVSDLAKAIGKHLGKKPIFIHEPSSTALISDASKAQSYFGAPQISADQMCKWTAQWIMSGQKLLNKPTHFQQRDGKF